MTIGKTTDETQIRALIEAWAKELRAKRVDALMSHRAPDILLYDLAPPLLHRGADTYRKGLQEWFATLGGLAQTGCQLLGTTGLSWADGRQGIVTFWHCPNGNTLRCLDYFDAEMSATGGRCDSVSAKK